MKISKSLRNTFLKLMAVVMVFTAFATIPATETNAAANKALKITASFGGDTRTETGRNKNTYIVDALYTKKQVKLKTNMTAQATVYIPKSLLSGMNCRFYLAPQVSMYDNMLKYVGTVYDKTSYIMVLNNGYNVKAYSLGSNGKYDLNKATSYAKVTTSGKYYKVTLKVPMDKVYYKSGKKSSIKTNKAYNVAVGVEIFGAETAGKGTIYVDDLKVNSKPSISINFSKKDYSPAAFNGATGKVKVSAAKVK